MRWEHGTTGSWNSLAGLQNRDKGGSTAHWHLILMLRPPSSGCLVGAPCFRACPPPRGRKALSSPQETAARFRGPQWRRPRAHTTPSARFPGESSSLPALGEKVLSEQELALPHPRSADKVSVWPPKLALCLLDGSGPGPGRTEGAGTGGPASHGTCAPRPGGFTQHGVLKAPGVAWAPASFPTLFSLYIPGLGKPLLGVCAGPLDPLQGELDRLHLAPDLAASLLSPVDHGGLWVPGDSHEFTAVIQQPPGGCDGPPYVSI